MKVLVLGGVAAGTKVAAKLMREDRSCEVTVLTKGKDISYAGCGLPYYVGGVIQAKSQLIVNTPAGKKGTVDDSYIRKAAIKNKIPYITTMAAAKAAVEGIRSARRDGRLPVKSLQEFHREITDK